MCLRVFEVLTPVVRHHESSDSSDERRSRKPAGLFTVRVQRARCHNRVTHLTVHTGVACLTLTMLCNHSVLIHPLEFHCSKRKADLIGKSLHAHDKPGEIMLPRKSGNTCYLLAEDLFVIGQ